MAPYTSTNPNITTKRRERDGPKLYLRKMAGYYHEFGLFEILRRTHRKLMRKARKTDIRLDIFFLTDNLALRTAPRDFEAMRWLKKLGFARVVDLRAERKPSDVLATTKEVYVDWIPTYDDWRPKAHEVFKNIEKVINAALSSFNTKMVLICCGSSEHRAPLAGVLGIVTMGTHWTMHFQK